MVGLASRGKGILAVVSWWQQRLPSENVAKCHPGSHRSWCHPGREISHPELLGDWLQKTTCSNYDHKDPQTFIRMTQLVHVACQGFFCLPVDSIGFLDFFLLIFFFGLYHGIHHHHWNHPLKEYVWFAFSIRILASCKSSRVPFSRLTTATWR